MKSCLAIELRRGIDGSRGTLLAHIEDAFLIRTVTIATESERRRMVAGIWMVTLISAGRNRPKVYSDIQTACNRIRSVFVAEKSNNSRSVQNNIPVSHGFAPVCDLPATLSATLSPWQFRLRLGWSQREWE